MTVERSDVGCPACGRTLQIIYATAHQQVVSGYACGHCGFATSAKHGDQSVAYPRPKEYVLRIEKPLSEEDVSDPLSDVEAEFRERARESIEDDEVWLLIDPDDDSLVDIVAGDSFPPEASE